MLVKNLPKFCVPGTRTHWKLSTKMLLLTTIVFAGFALSVVLNTLTLNQVKVGSPLYMKIRNDKDSLESIALLMSNLNQINAVAFHLIAEDEPDRIKASIRELVRLETVINEKFAVVFRLLDGEEKKVAVQDAKGTWKEFAATLHEELVPAVQQKNRIKARQLALEVQGARYERFIEQIGSVVDKTKLEIEALETDSGKSVNRKIALSAAFSGGMVFLILIAAIIVTRSVTRPIRRGADFARSVAEGNLMETLEARQGDEVGDLIGALNSMVGSLNGMVRKVDNSADDLSRISSTLNDAATRMVSAAQTQSNGVDETSSAMCEISVSLKEVAHLVDQLARSASESSSSILEMVASIGGVAQNIDNLAQSVGDVSSSVIQMTSSIKQVSDGASTLMDVSATTASSMNEMDKAIRQIEEHATETAGITDTVCQDAERGRSAVEATINGIDQIRQSSRVTSEVIDTLVERAKDIGAILNVIDEVAEQTNLLALNAAIIAAQAGERGKGFAVVAVEIKELSDRTSVSTREIAQVVKSVQSETRRAAQAIGMAEQSIATGGELSTNAGIALDKIVAGAQKASGQMAEIVRATVGQSRGSQDIRDAMTMVTDMVGQFARASKEQALSSELIRTAVVRMDELASQVRYSVREQSVAGNSIAESTENISTMIQQIKRACDEQSRGGEQIIVAVEEIQQSTRVSLDTATIMHDAANRLASQVDFLHEEMQAFKV